MPGLQLSFGAISQMFLHSFLSARSVAQLVECLSCKQKTRVQVPAVPTLFKQGKYQKFYESKQEWINTKEPGKKYENREDLKEDMAEFYEDIFKYRPRTENKISVLF